MRSFIASLILWLLAIQGYGTTSIPEVSINSPPEIDTIDCTNISMVHPVQSKPADAMLLKEQHRIDMITLAEDVIPNREAELKKNCTLSLQQCCPGHCRSNDHFHPWQGITITHIILLNMFIYPL